MSQKRARQSIFQNQVREASSTWWTLKEKNALSEALKKYGTLDLQKIADFIGTRTAQEVKHVMNRRRQSIKISAENKLSPHVDRWCEFMRFSIDKYVRSVDLSDSLADVMQTLIEEHAEDADEEINFGQIYSYLQNILSGAIPPIPGSTESLIIFKIATELAQIFKRNAFDEEKALLKNLDKRPMRPIPEEFKVIPAVPQNCVRKGRRVQGKISSKDGRKLEEHRAEKEELSRSTSHVDNSREAETEDSIRDDTSSREVGNDESLPSTSLENGSREAETGSNVVDDDSAKIRLSDYPAYNLYQHKFKMLLYGANPLQIPVEFVDRSRVHVQL